MSSDDAAKTESKAGAEIEAKSEKAEASTDKAAPKEKEKPVELEEDAADDARPRNKQAVKLNEADCTMDVMLSNGGAVASSICSGGFQYLCSAVRATVGAKAGRYYFELKVLDNKKGPGESYCRVGFSTLDSSLFLGDFSCQGRSYFDSSPKWFSNTVGVLLNLVEGSPNAYTCSLFINGSRSGPPKALSDGLKDALKSGAALYPTVSFNNLTLMCNFGQAGQLAQLPFKVRMFGDIAQDDAAPGKAALKGKCEVVVPVGLPEEGLFDWADRFLEANPNFEELSDRSLLKWYTRSQLQGKGGGKGGGSRDRPRFNFGIHDVDNRNARAGLQSLMLVQPRNYLVLEAKGNLLKKFRGELLKRFAAPHFKKRAVVAIGEPKQDFKDWVHKTIKSRHAEKKQRQKAIAERRAKQQALKEAKKAGSDEKKEDAEPAKEEAPEEEAEPEIGPDVKYLPKPKDLLDIAKDQLGAFEQFELPAADEGFDEVSYEWLPEAAAQDHLKKWQRERKATEIIKDLKPSDWFKEKLKKWQEIRKEYKTKHGEYLALKRKEKKEDPADFDDKELDGCTDVNDLIDGAPVYGKFRHEDWTLLNWRYELHLLAHAFKHDVTDPDRPGLPVERLAHYSKLYLEKAYNPMGLGCKDLDGVMDLLNGSVKISGDKNKVLAPVLGEDEDIASFVKQTEDARRDRIRRIEAGDESCILNIPKGGGADGKGLKGKGGKDVGKGKRPRESSVDERPAKFVRHTSLPTRPVGGPPRISSRPGGVASRGPPNRGKGAPAYQAHPAKRFPPQQSKGAYGKGYSKSGGKKGDGKRFVRRY